MNYEFLNEKEKKVMSSLYKLGEVGVGEIAKETMINRTTVYPIIEELVKRGLVSKILIEKKSIYRAISIEEFKTWVKNKQEKFKQSSSDLIGWAESQKEKDKKSLLSEIRYFEGHDGVESLYADTWRNNKDKIIYAITDYKTAMKSMGNFFSKKYFPNRIKHGVRVNNLIPESPEGRRDTKDNAKFLRKTKFIKLFKDLEIELNIYDQKVAFVAFDKKKPTGVIIKNQKIAEALREIFDYIWKSK